MPVSSCCAEGYVSAMYRNVLLALHIASVAGWLGCNLTQLFLSRWFVRRGGDAAVAWFEATNRLARRYYNVVGEGRCAVERQNRSIRPGGARQMRSDR